VILPFLKLTANGEAEAAGDDMAKLTAEQILFKANAHAKKGEFAEARQLYRIVLQGQPNNKPAKLGLARLDDIAPETPQPPAELISALAAAYNAGHITTVESQIAAALRQYPASYLLWNIEGLRLRALAQYERAAGAFSEVSRLAPGYADGYNNLGITLLDLGRPQAAEEALEKAVSLRADYAEAQNNLGNALKAQGKLAAAMRCYEKAIQLRPDFAEAHSNLGSAHRERGNLDQAVAHLRRAVMQKPNFAEAYVHLASAWKDRGDIAAAVECLARAVELKPDHQAARGQLLHLRQHACDWTCTNEMTAALPTLGLVGACVPPFTTLATEDNPERQKLRSVNWRKQTYWQQPLPLEKPAPERPAKLRIGYFGADFHDHATLFLMAGLLRTHDRNRFEIRVYSYGRHKKGVWRDRMLDHVDSFADVHSLDDEEIIRQAREDRLDIAIDLKGYTGDTRSELFASRLAPVQIAYLGYPGSMGADFIDYMIADPVVIPPEERKAYTEHVIFLPHTYQPTDDQRHIPETTTSRADFGLPEEAFVFCSFNNNYKIGHAEFDIWMRLLHAIPESVLWLLRSNPAAEVNLHREAEARGVASGRIIFAEKVEQPAHLARHRHADLFLDTFNYNAHTTASDALWAGLPVVTKRGRQFSARVAASLLSAIGLEELVTETAEAYEKLILALAQDPTRLAELRTRLAANRQTHPLFDTKQYTRYFEAGLDAAHRRYREGLEPADITVAATPV
jgi:predicted O-linked N-acetylglucosamine transferase (SPINDLY family)